jgi:hypothetical protein
VTALILKSDSNAITIAYSAYREKNGNASNPEAFQNCAADLRKAAKKI